MLRNLNYLLIDDYWYEKVTIDFFLIFYFHFILAH